MKGRYRMLEDILNESFEIEIDGLKYKFEFDHLAYAILEKETGKSIYWFYDELILGKNVTFSDLFGFVNAAMKRHHSQEEIYAFQNKLREKPYVFNLVKGGLYTSFLVPLTPPEVFGMFKKKDSKKTRITKKKSKN